MVGDLRAALLGGLTGWNADTSTPDEWMHMAADRGLFRLIDVLRDLPTHYDSVSIDTDLRIAKQAAREATTPAGGFDPMRPETYEAVVSLAGAFVRGPTEFGRATGVLNTTDGPLRISGLEPTTLTGALYLVGVIRAYYSRGDWTYSIHSPLAWPVDPPALVPRWDAMSRGVCALRIVVTQSCLAYMTEVADGDPDELAGIDRFKKVTSPSPDELEWAESPAGRTEVLDWLPWLLGPADPGYDDRLHGGNRATFQSKGVLERLIKGSHPFPEEDHSAGLASSGEPAGRRELPAPRMLKGHAAAEEYAAEVLRALGYPDAARTPAGADGGVDVAGAGLVAQVKMEALPTGRDRLQALFGVAAVEEARAAFFSLAGYTDQARAWGERAGIALFEFGFDGSIDAVNEVALSMLTISDA
jgi:hypothetical protein